MHTEDASTNPDEPRNVDLPAADLARLLGDRPDLRVTGIALAAVSAFVLTVASMHDTHKMLTKPTPRAITYPAVVLAHTPLVYLRLADRSGVTANDSSTNRHDGLYIDHPDLGSKGLLSNGADRAVRFNGTTQYAYVHGGSWMNVPDYTIVVWFETTATGSYLVSRDDFNGSKVWDVLVDSFGRIQFLTFRPGFGAGQAAVSPRSYNDGHRHMIACAKSGSTLNLYLDGTLTASARYDGFVQDTGTLDIDLARRGNGVGYLPGTLDEFSFYGKGLAGVDVSSLYATGVTPRQ